LIDVELVCQLIVWGRFSKNLDEFTIINSSQLSYDELTTKFNDEFTIINMLIFKRSNDDFMILSYDKVMIKNFQS